MLNLILTFLTGIIVSIYAVSRVLKLAIARNLLDEPDKDRKIHTRSVPVLGGLGLFIALAFAFTAFTFDGMPKGLIRTFGGIIALFMIGLKDDLLPSRPIRRLIYETMVSLVLIIGSDIRFSNMFGIFGYHQINYWPSVILTWLFIVGMVNAYNMIDGIDGLLGSISLLGALCYAWIFFVYKDYHWAQFSLALAGALVGFLYFNTYPARIFMGDSGSMLLGGAFSVMSLHFLNFTSFESADLRFLCPPVIGISIVAIPVFDMMVVFAIRMINRVSPLKADRRHCHHRLLDLGLNHFQATMILLSANLLVIVFGYYLQMYFSMYTSVISLILCVLGLEGLLLLLHFRRQKTTVREVIGEEKVVLLKVKI